MRQDAGMISRREFLKQGGLVSAGMLAGASAWGQDRQPSVWLGIDLIERDNFRQLRGKRVGLLTHPAGHNRYGRPSVEVLHQSPLVRLVALFGPEHGIYGDEAASQPVADRTDARTGLPVYSLYGRYRKPTPEMLAQIDVLVIDLQDIGTRSYTFTSCMRYAVEACFENDTEVIVLDRPNPLGGLKVDGPLMEERWLSYVGAFQVPYVHGLTIGELASMSRALPGWLQVSEPVRRRGKLSVISMMGWQRNMRWPATGLRWVPTSPYIPDLSAVLGYPMTGLGGQIGSFSHGIGTPYPFRLLRHKLRSPEMIAEALRASGIAGLDYLPLQTESQGERRFPVRGLYVKVADWERLSPTALNFHMMRLAAEWEDNPFARALESEVILYNKHVGSTEWWEEIRTRGAEARVDSFLQRWQRQSAAFQATSRRYWLYR